MSNWVCAACGGENPEGMNFCGHCGAPVVSAPATTDGDQDVADALRSFVAGPVADKLVEGGGTLPEERRLITALFADVSGFTSLADRLDPEQLLEVIDPVISGLSTVVGKYGGYVEKFAGDALMALFGAPVSHEDDAARALRVALEMHSELARLVGDLPHDAELTLHVGVNSGHGIARILGSEARMDYAVLGDSVILAQRLESAAPPGETYVSETTVQLAEADFEFESVGELTLKGKSEPVPAWRLLGARAERVRETGASLIGRQTELAFTAELLAELHSGRGGVLAITGEAGIGKSRLAEVVFERATADGARLLHARCVSYGAGLAYWPYLDLLRRTTGLRTTESPAHTRARLSAELYAASAAETAPYFARLLGLPVDDDDVTGLEPEAFRRGLHDSFRKWSAALAAETPIVLAVEDLHWADASSLALTAELTQLAQRLPVLFVLLGRPEAREQIAATTASTMYRSIELEPFDETGVRELAATVLGGAPPAALVEFILRRTSGNPFFAQELVRALKDGGALVATDGELTIQPGWDERQLPPTIEGVLTARIDLLPRQAAAVLQTASVIGRRARVSLLEAIVPGKELESPLEELVQARLLDRSEDDGEPVVVFQHALVQDAAYSRLLRRRRKQLHLRVAEVAEELYGSGDHVIDLLARHLYLSESPKAREYLLRAGDRALKLFANDEAILHLSRALELEPENTEIKLQLADLKELVGAYEDALALYEDVRRRTNDVRAWRGAAATLRRRAQYIDALATVDSAFATPELKGQDLIPLWLEASWTLVTIGHGEQAADVLDAAVEVIRARGEGQLSEVLAQLARVEASLGRYQQALEHGIEAEQLAEAAGDLRTLVLSFRVLSLTYWHVDKLDAAAEAARRGLALAERVGSSEELGACLVNLGLIEKRRENYDEAVACTQRAIEEFERAGSEGSRAQAHANLAGILEEAGRLEEALACCDQAEQLARAIGYPIAIANITDTRAMIELKQGKFEAAAARAEEAARLYLDFGTAPDALGMLELAAEAWRRAGEDSRAQECDSRARELTLA